MSDVERKAAVDSLKPLWYNAIAMSFVAIATSIMVNFAYDAIVILVPLIFAAACIGLTAQYRRSLRAVKKTLTDGSIPELKAVPAKKSMGRGWTVGPITFARSGELSGMFSEGTQAAVAFLPETKAALSVNGVPLRKPMPMVAPIGFGVGLASQVPAMQPQIPVYSPTSAPQQSPQAAEEELPPPPEDWAERACPQCGLSLPKYAMFCSKCGFRISR